MSNKCKLSINTCSVNVQLLFTSLQPTMISPFSPRDVSWIVLLRQDLLSNAQVKEKLRAAQIHKAPISQGAPLRWRTFP